MPFAAAISSAARNARRPQGLRKEKWGFLNQDLSVSLNSSSSARNARRFQGGHGASEEETMPLNSNGKNDCEDIENPFRIPSEVSKWDEPCCQITVVVLMLAIRDETRQMKQEG